MDESKIPAGKDVPNDINVIIEIPQGSSIKYEVDKASGAIFVDRFLFTPMYYPCNYGYVPATLSDDGDPVDVLVISPEAVVPGSVIRCRPIGVLLMEDESGQDEKIIAVPHDKVTTEFTDITDIDDLPKLTVQKIQHFFERYKDLEPNKWVKVTGFEGADTAKAKILEGFDRAS